MSTEMEQFRIWWIHDDQHELRKSCAMGWGFYIWQAATHAAERKLMPFVPAMDMDEARIDLIAASHGDGEHYGEVGE